MSLRDEFEDIRAAVDHYLSTKQGDAVAQLVWPLYWFWWITGRLPEVGGWAARLDEIGYEVSEQTRFRAKFYVAALASWKRPDPSRIPDFEDCLAYFLREHDAFGEFLARMTIAMLELIRGASGVDAADENLQLAQGIAEDIHSPFLTAMALLIRGQALMARRDVQKATQAFEAGLHAAEVSGEVLSQSDRALPTRVGAGAPRQPWHCS